MIFKLYTILLNSILIFLEKENKNDTCVGVGKGHIA